jgi:hypothetical protein
MEETIGREGHEKVDKHRPVVSIGYRDRPSIGQWRVSLSSRVRKEMQVCPRGTEQPMKEKIIPRTPRYITSSIQSAPYRVDVHLPLCME